MRYRGNVLGALTGILLSVPSALTAQTPACGSVIDTPHTTVTFDSDLICPPGFTGTALTVTADGTTVDGAGFAIQGPEADRLVFVDRASAVTVRDLTLSDNPGAGVLLLETSDSELSNVQVSGLGVGAGIEVNGGSDNLISGNTVHGRHSGIFTGGWPSSGNVYSGNDLTDNSYAFHDYYGAGVGNAYVANDLSRASGFGLILYSEVDPVISGNIFTDCANGIRFGNMDSFVFTDRDLSVWNIPGTVLQFIDCTNCTVSGIDASGSGLVGGGIGFSGGSNNLVTGNTVHGRNVGISTGGGSSSNNTYSANNLTDNRQALYDYYGAGVDNVYVDNDLSRAAGFGLTVSREVGPVISGNIFTDCANGIRVHEMDSFVFSDRDLSVWNIPGTVLEFIDCTSCTVSGIDASGPAGTGLGIRVTGGSDSLYAGNTIHGRHTGIALGSLPGSNHTFSGNDLAGNSVGISGYWAGLGGHAYVDNNVSGSSLYGLSLYGDDLLVRDNVCTGSARGIVLRDGEAGIVAGNDLSATTILGLGLSAREGDEIRENLIVGGDGRGLEVLDSSDVRVYHNNIFGQQGEQVFSDTAIELSYGNEGNYWGRACPDPLFIAAEDSNAYDVLDSNPYGLFDGWLHQVDPGCGPPPPGSIAGEVRDSFSGVQSVYVSLTDSGEVLLGETTTAADGAYGFADITPGLYAVSIIVPIGFAPASPTEIEATVHSDEETTVDFLLERLVIAVETRGLGYWKHQAKANLTGRGHTDESAESLLAYLEAIQEQYDLFDEVVGLGGLLAELDPAKPSTMRERAEQHLMTLLLNLASLRIATYTVVSFDDTAGEAIDYILQTMADAGSNRAELEMMKDLAEDINEGHIPIDPDRVPEPTN